MTLIRIATNGIHLEVKDWGGGPGPDLVLCHGLGTSFRSFDPVIPNLRSHFHCWGVNMRGHGGSSWPVDGYTPENMARDLLGVLDHLELEHPLLLGHSMGGRAGWYLASEVPGRLKGLVITDIGPDAQPAQLESMERLQEHFSETTDFRQDHELRYLEHGFRSGLNISPSRAEISNLLGAMMRPVTGSDLWQWNFHPPVWVEIPRLGREESTWDAFRRVKDPILLIHCRNSFEISPEVVTEMKSVQAAMRVTELEGTNHPFLFFTHPDEVAAAVISFAEDL